MERKGKDFCDGGGDGDGGGCDDGAGGDGGVKLTPSPQRRTCRSRASPLWRWIGTCVFVKGEKDFLSLGDTRIYICIFAGLC